MFSRPALALLASLALATAASAQIIHFPSTVFDGDAPFDFLGTSVSDAGDVNNDGFADIIVGAPFADNNGDNSGSARVFSGLDGSTLHTFNGDSEEDQFGWSVSGAGDVNNDGFDDLIVGAPFDDNSGSNSGSARIFSGATGAILYTFNGDSTGDEFGRSVSGSGDVNNDGFDDVIVGAPFDDNTGFESGSARIFSGATGAILYTFDGDSAGDQFARSVSGAGDVNNDGFADAIVGAHLDDINVSDSGSATVFSGATGAVLYTFNGDSGSDQFGYSVSNAGDVNNDGFSDLIVGAWLDDNNGSESGSARVFSGIDGSTLYTFNGDSVSDRFGASVSSAGDVNNDGFADLIVGAYRDDNSGSNSGSFRVFSGSNGNIIYTFNGDFTTDEFGTSVSSAGDINGDGHDDLIIGIPNADNNGDNSGSARIFRSGPACPGDADLNRIINFSDITFVLLTYGTSPHSFGPGDADGNTIVNFVDITTVLANFNIICP